MPNLKIKQQYTMTIGSHFLSPIFNADLSGLNDHETQLAIKLIEDIGTGCVSIIEKDYDQSCDTFLARCDVTNLASNCVEIQVTHFKQSKKA